VEPPRAIEAPPAVSAAAREGEPADAFDASLIEVIQRPPAPTDTALVAYQRKELELRALFATLSPADNLRLQRRLEAARRGDLVAAAFGRLVVERRSRLLRFLADTRQRRPR